MTYIELIVILCVVGMVVFGIAMAANRSILKAAICLAVVSALLAIAMFMMGAVWAGVFELSVCSGLITVIFISALTVTAESKKERSKQEEENHKSNRILPWIYIATGVIVLALMAFSNFNLDGHAIVNETGTFSEVLWSTRQSDLLGVGVTVLAGAFAIIVLFKQRRKK